MSKYDTKSISISIQRIQIYSYFLSSNNHEGEGLYQCICIRPNLQKKQRKNEMTS